MARYSLLEKLAGHAEPEVDGTAIMKLASAYGRSEPEFDGGAIMKLAEAYGQTKQAGLSDVKEKLLKMVGLQPRESTGKKVGKGALLAGLGAGGAYAAMNKDSILSRLKDLMSSGAKGAAKAAPPDMSMSKVPLAGSKAYLMKLLKSIDDSNEMLDGGQLAKQLASKGNIMKGMAGHF